MDRADPDCVLLFLCPKPTRARCKNLNDATFILICLFTLITVVCSKCVNKAAQHRPGPPLRTLSHSCIHTDPAQPGLSRVTSWEVRNIILCVVWIIDVLTFLTVLHIILHVHVEHRYRGTSVLVKQTGLWIRHEDS